MAKKALSIRSTGGTRADARPKPGALLGARGAKRSDSCQGRIDWLATLRAGRPHTRQALIYAAASAQAPELWLIILDASASTRRHGALSQAKGLLSAIFEQAYRQRAQLAVLTFNQGQVHWQIKGRPVRRSLQHWLIEQGAGGGTPLWDSLREACRWLHRRQTTHPFEPQRLLILTDGRVKDECVPSRAPCPAWVIDMECSPIRLGRARQLATELGAEYSTLDSYSRG